MGWARVHTCRVIGGREGYRQVGRTRVHTCRVAGGRGGTGGWVGLESILAGSLESERGTDRWVVLVGLLEAEGDTGGWVGLESVLAGLTENDGDTTGFVSVFEVHVGLTLGAKCGSCAAVLLVEV